jgi:hypothetical protein
MILFYRRRKTDEEWHFHTLCPRWPQTDFVQVRVLNPGSSERLCQQCVKLDREMFPPEK